MKRTAYEKIWQLLSSINTSVFLLGTICLSILVGVMSSPEPRPQLALLWDIGIWKWLTEIGAPKWQGLWWFITLFILLSFLFLNTACCSIPQMWKLFHRLKPQRLKARAIRSRLAIQGIHLAFLFLLLGYALSLCFSCSTRGVVLPLDQTILVPGQDLSLQLLRLKRVRYRGRLEAFKGETVGVDADIILRSGKETEEKRLSLSRAIFFKNHVITLKKFPNSLRKKWVMVDVRHDPGLPLYLSGALLIGVSSFCYALVALENVFKGGFSVKIFGLSHLLPLLILTIFLVSGCQGPKDNSQSFLTIGQFSIETLDGGVKLLRDGIGRRFLLIPRGKPIPEHPSGIPIIRTPVERVIASRYFDVCTLKALGVLDTLVGVTIPSDQWHTQEMKRRLKKGLTKYVGRSGAVDYELIKRLHPQLVLTWDVSSISMFDSLGIPAVVTTTPVAMCLSARMRFVEFMAPFFNKEDKAALFFQRVKKALQDIRSRTALAGFKPKVMWGDIYEKRVLVEPGNSWIGQLVALVNSDYLFEDIYGASCIEINLERFLYSGKDADIYFTYRTPESGASSKEAIKALNPLISKIKPLGPEGRVYAPLADFNERQDRLDEIFREIAAILHPDLYPGHSLKFFRRLPEREPFKGQGDTQREGQR